jgi:outer membrane protein W
VLPVCLAVQYHIPMAETMATFNLLAGAGYYFIDYTMGDAPSAVFAASGVAGLPDQVVNDSWGFHAGAGVEYAFSGWFSLTAEGRYVFCSPGVSGTAKDNYTLGGSLDLNTWLFTGGIKISF